MRGDIRRLSTTTIQGMVSPHWIGYKLYSYHNLGSMLPIAGVAVRRAQIEFINNCQHMIILDVAQTSAIVAFTNKLAHINIITHIQNGSDIRAHTHIEPHIVMVLSD
jgi:hypothetical protein